MTALRQMNLSSPLFYCSPFQTSRFAMPQQPKNDPNGPRMNLDAADFTRIIFSLSLSSFKVKYVSVAAGLVYSAVKWSVGVRAGPGRVTSDWWAWDWWKMETLSQPGSPAPDKTVEIITNHFKKKKKKQSEIFCDHSEAVWSFFFFFFWFLLLIRLLYNKSTVTCIVVHYQPHFVSKAQSF